MKIVSQALLKPQQDLRFRSGSPEFKCTLLMQYVKA